MKGRYKDALEKIKEWLVTECKAVLKINLIREEEHVEITCKRLK